MKIDIKYLAAFKNLFQAPFSDEQKATLSREVLHSICLLT